MNPISSQIDKELLAHLVSPRVGIIRSLFRMSTEDVEPMPAVLYEAKLADFDFMSEAVKKARVGVGKGETDAEAMTGAVGEAIERYCAWQPNYDLYLEASAGELGSKAIHPDQFVLYSVEQYQNDEIIFSPFDAGKAMHWVPGVSLKGQEQLYVPASLAYIGYSGLRMNEELCLSTSNGLAAGRSIEKAVLSGLYELIERDGFLIAWMNRLSVAEIDLEGLAGLPHHIHSFYRGLGIDIRVFNATSDIPVPVMMGFAIDKTGEGPASVIGLGCDLNPAAALKKALLEVCQGRVSETWRFRHRSKHQRVLKFEDVKKLEDHGAFFAEAENLPQLDFLLETSRRQQLDDIPNLSQHDAETNLATCTRLLEAAGIKVAYVDLTTPDIAPLGLRVVRSVATGLQPIHFGYKQERLGGRRIFEVPYRLGLASQVRNVEELNRCPHPLP